MTISPAIMTGTSSVLVWLLCVCFKWTIVDCLKHETGLSILHCCWIYIPQVSYVGIAFGPQACTNSLLELLAHRYNTAQC